MVLAARSPLIALALLGMLAPTAQAASTASKLAAKGPCAQTPAMITQAWLLLGSNFDDSAPATPGTVCWTEGREADGTPYIEAHLSLPDAEFGLDADLSLHKNLDASLPAAMLLEVDFAPTNGDEIASMPGLLTKNEPLVVGVPLIGASARIVGNAFIFALSGDETDAASNVEQLAQPYLDIAVVTSAGKNAIVTLAIDGEAAQLMRKTLAAWEE